MITLEKRTHRSVISLVLFCLPLLFSGLNPSALHIFWYEVNAQTEL